MQKTIHVNTTTARQNFFDLYNRVQNEDIEVIIEHGKRASGKAVVLKAQPKKKQGKATKKTFNLKKLAGRFHIGTAIHNETRIAHMMYALEQGIKFERGTQ